MCLVKEIRDKIEKTTESEREKERVNGEKREITYILFTD